MELLNTSEEVPSSEIPLSSLPVSQRYLNRELSWLAFNYRVLEEAQNAANPLLERLRYLAISDSNLDEFCTVRVANLKGRLESGLDQLTFDGLTLPQQLEMIYSEIIELVREQQHTWQSLRRALADEGLRLVQVNDLDQDDLEWLTSYFMSEVLPVLTPLACDPAHPFPFIPNDGLCMGMKMKDTKSFWSLLPLPPSLPRFIRMGDNPRRDLVRSSSFEGRR